MRTRSCLIARFVRASLGYETRFSLFLILMGACVVSSEAGPVPTGKPASYPDWWFERDVIPRLNTSVINPFWPSDYAVADDYAAVNQGQVKNMAKQAYAEMEAKLPGGAGSTLGLIWATPGASSDDYTAINIGQLKNLAAPFYDRLKAGGLVRGYPWSGVGADDYGLVNAGQVKNIFSFNIPMVFNVLNLDGDACWTHGR